MNGNGRLVVIIDVRHAVLLTFNIISNQKSILFLQSSLLHSVKEVKLTLAQTDGAVSKRAKIQTAINALLQLCSVQNDRDFIGYTMTKYL